MKTKTFDCLEMKEEGTRRIYEEIKDLSRDELVAYWQSKNDTFEESLARLKRLHTVAKEQSGGHVADEIEDVPVTKSFDCVEMKWKAQERIYEETKNLTHEEKVAYWNEKNERFAENLAQLKSNTDRENS